jgi:hypothetical protein
MANDNTRVKKASVEVTDDSILWTFADGAVSTFELSRCPADTVRQLALHGAKQKASDCYAGLTDVGEAFAANQDVIELLYQGLWSAKREAAGEKQSSMVVEAYNRVCADVAKYRDATREENIARWKSYDDDRRKQIASAPAFKVKLEAVKAERAAAQAEARAKRLATLQAQAAESDIGNIV